MIIRVPRIIGIVSQHNPKSVRGYVFDTKCKVLITEYYRNDYVFCQSVFFFYVSSSAEFT